MLLCLLVGAWSQLMGSDSRYFAFAKGVDLFVAAGYPKKDAVDFANRLEAWRTDPRGGSTPLDGMF